MTVEFTEEEIETIKDLINEHGCDCPSTDSDKILALAIKLGLEKNYSDWDEAGAKRRQEFKNSPLAKQMTEMFSRFNGYMAKKLLDRKELFIFSDGIQWPVGTKLRIRLPTEYNKE